MRLRALLLVGLVAIVTVPALARSSTSVRPSSGLRTTHFIVRFRAPVATGVVGHTNRRYVVSARGPAVSGCDSTPAAGAPPTRAGNQVNVSLAPDRRGWCRGTYTGHIEELASAVCTPGRLCPQYVAILRHVGSFRFGFR
jgi:hypothetical protein